MSMFWKVKCEWVWVVFFNLCFSCCLRHTHVLVTRKCCFVSTSLNVLNGAWMLSIRLAVLKSVSPSMVFTIEFLSDQYRIKYLNLHLPVLVIEEYSSHDLLSNFSIFPQPALEKYWSESRVLSVTFGFQSSALVSQFQEELLVYFVLTCSTQFPLLFDSSLAPSRMQARVMQTRRRSYTLSTTMAVRKHVSNIS